jgi:hypothetical protein
METFLCERYAWFWKGRVETKLLYINSLSGTYNNGTTNNHFPVLENAERACGWYWMCKSLCIVLTPCPEVNLMLDC